MSDEWASDQIEPERNGAQGAWLQPARHQAYSSPSIVPVAGDMSRNITDDRAIRVYEARWKWVGRDGTEIQATGRQIVTLYLEKRNDRWVVVTHHCRYLPSDP